MIQTAVAFPIRGQSRQLMQVCQVIHAAVAILLAAADFVFDDVVLLANRLPLFAVAPESLFPAVQFLDRVDASVKHQGVVGFKAGRRRRVAEIDPPWRA